MLANSNLLVCFVATVSDSTRQFLFLLASTRRQGNSEQLAHAAHSLPAGAQAHWLSLLDYPLPAFVDQSQQGPYPPPVGNAQRLLAATLQATDLVLVAPLYWYALPTPAKLYLDYWSAWLRTPNLAFRAQMQGKTLWAIMASTGSWAEVQPLADTLKLTAQYMHMPWGGLLLGKGTRPGDIRQDATALREAATFFTAPASPR